MKVTIPVILMYGGISRMTPVSSIPVLLNLTLPELQDRHHRDTTSFLPSTKTVITLQA
jgi:hypothetical protein